jgi:hypothetical protein
MKAPLDPFSRVTDEQSHWDPEWYSWLQDLFTTTTQLQANVVTLQTALATQQAINTAQQANNTAQQAAITALQNPPPGVSPGLIFLSVQTANNSPTLVFTGMNSTYAAYQFHATGLRPSVNNQPLYMQMSLDGGATWKNTSNIWTWLYSYIGGGATPLAYSSASEGNTTYFRIGGVTNSTWGNSSETTVYPNSGQNLNMASWRSSDYYDAGSGTYQVIGSGHEVSDATPCNAVRFFFASGTIVGGRIAMYGLKKA